MLMQISASPNSLLVTDKRRSQRLEQDIDADLLDHGLRPAGEAVRLMDISTVGVGIESDHEFQIGDRLDFRMTVDEGRPMSAGAVVRWVRPWGISFSYGLELQGLGYYDRNRLRRYLDPNHFGVEEFATLLLQAASTMMGLYVAYDWISSDPVRARMMMFAMPWMIYFASAFLMAWFAKSRL